MIVRPISSSIALWSLVPNRWSAQLCLEVYTVRVKRETWSAIGRWLSVPPVFMGGSFAASVMLMFVLFLETIWLQWAAGHLRLNVPPNLLLTLFEVIAFFLIITICTIPTAFAVGFALRTNKSIRYQWGLSAALLLTIAFFWSTKRHEFGPAFHPIVVSAILCLVSGIALSFRVAHKVRAHLLTNVLVLAFLVLPFVALAAKQPPSARRLWSIVLGQGKWPGVQPGTEFLATHHVAIVGDRVLAVFDAGYAQSTDKEFASKYELVSVEVQTGEIKNSREFDGRWGVMPNLFPTNDGHVILEQGSLKSLNPDLTDAALAPNIYDGRVVDISPDGSTLAWATDGETVLLDSHTLASVGKRFAEPTADSVSASAVLTFEKFWKQYPKDSTFVGLTDERGLRLLFHGDCGIPRFLNNEKVILVGCGKIRILDLAGVIHKEVETGRGPARLANVSQNGKRFALECSDERGDSPVLLYDYFLVFDAESLQPVMRINGSETPARQPWSAFSSDARYFVAGNPDNLSLYQLQ
jgi:hypothetical protein